MFATPDARLGLFRVSSRRHHRRARLRFERRQLFGDGVHRVRDGRLDPREARLRARLRVAHRVVQHGEFRAEGRRGGGGVFGGGGGVFGVDARGFRGGDGGAIGGGAVSDGRDGGGDFLRATLQRGHDRFHLRRATNRARDAVRDARGGLVLVVDASTKFRLDAAHVLGRRLGDVRRFRRVRLGATAKLGDGGVERLGEGFLFRDAPFAVGVERGVRGFLGATNGAVGGDARRRLRRGAKRVFRLGGGFASGRAIGGVVVVARVRALAKRLRGRHHGRQRHAKFALFRLEGIRAFLV